MKKWKEQKSYEITFKKLKTMTKQDEVQSETLIY